MFPGVLRNTAHYIDITLRFNLVKRDIEQVRATGKISYPFLGIQYVILDEEVAKERSLPVTHGALIIKGWDGSLAVVADSPAARAGLSVKT